MEEARKLSLRTVFVTVKRLGIGTTYRDYAVPALGRFSFKQNKEKGSFDYDFALLENND